MEDFLKQIQECPLELIWDIDIIKGEKSKAMLINDSEEAKDLFNISYDSEKVIEDFIETFIQQHPEHTILYAKKGSSRPVMTIYNPIRKA